MNAEKLLLRVLFLIARICADKLPFELKNEVKNLDTQVNLYYGKDEIK